MSEVQELEFAEYKDAVEALIRQPAFVRFLAQWILDVEGLTEGPVAPEGLAMHNYRVGRASQTREFMASAEVLYPDAHRAIREEVNRNAARRRAEQ